MTTTQQTMRHDTAHKIMNSIVYVLPLGYKVPKDQKAADRDKARFIFEQQAELMKLRGFKSSDELLQKYLTDPHGQLPLGPHEL